MKLRKGFTLVELLVVILIIMILMSILLVAMFGAYNSSSRADAMLMIRNIYNGIETFKVEHMCYPTPESGYFYSITDDNSAASTAGNGIVEYDDTVGNNSIAEYFSFDREYLQKEDSTYTYKSLMDPWEQPYKYADKANAGTWFSSSLTGDSNVGSADKTVISNSFPTHDIYIWSAGEDNFNSANQSKAYLDKWRDEDSGTDLPIYRKKGE